MPVRSTSLIGGHTGNVVEQIMQLSRLCASAKPAGQHCVEALLQRVISSQVIQPLTVELRDYVAGKVSLVESFGDQILVRDEVHRLGLVSTRILGARGETKPQRVRPLTIDFTCNDYMRRRVSGMPIVAACGSGLILDTTAGLGRDAFTLAAQSSNRVLMIERNPLLALLLVDGLMRLRASADAATAAIGDRLAVISADSVALLSDAYQSTQTLDAYQSSQTLDAYQTARTHASASPKADVRDASPRRESFFVGWPVDGEATQPVMEYAHIMEAVCRVRFDCAFVDLMWSGVGRHGDVKYFSKATPKLSMQYLSALETPVADKQAEMLHHIRTVALNRPKRIVVKHHDRKLLQEIANHISEYTLLKKPQKSSTAEFAVLQADNLAP